ncbi:hypothetical protein TTHERM_00775900 (macronuclear) [Tetrahymena thermophila SB210]|uniref:Uncharacterized protein n=1 Tax=Tetrahymena thermophila (strain SB210) TaxID=312017 RepID=Q23WW6_TETTS|nr:hypothetical protein TTHERM_00775900 [Tetrahymena thermophila SB210]EAS00979.1 hypothetical protein TTHERM_00775900 [Tetrahymena thermophila SB210]|eukprot:XP_001021224.1 hypothetical protein TTHERM_00775900 [Tetrahymena thermophila SB210]
MKLDNIQKEDFNTSKVGFLSSIQFFQDEIKISKEGKFFEQINNFIKQRKFENKYESSFIIMCKKSTSRYQDSVIKVTCCFIVNCCNKENMLFRLPRKERIFLFFQYCNDPDLVPRYSGETNECQKSEKVLNKQITTLQKEHINL